MRSELIVVSKVTIKYRPVEMFRKLDLRAESYRMMLDGCSSNCCVCHHVHNSLPLVILSQFNQFIS